eukprot:734786_1
MGEKLLTEHNPGIDIFEFGATAMNANITGHTFIKGTPQYKNSLRFAKIFKSVKGYKKKDFTNIYTKINSRWDHIEVVTDLAEHVEMKCDDAHDTEMQMEHDESKDNLNPTTQPNERRDIYEIGTQFYYWQSHRHHPRYIHPKYSDLKEETLN